MWIAVLYLIHWISISNTGICTWTKSSLGDFDTVTSLGTFGLRESQLVPVLCFKDPEPGSYQLSVPWKLIHAKLKIKLPWRLKQIPECPLLTVCNCHVKHRYSCLHDWPISTYSQLYGDIITRRDFNNLHGLSLSHVPESYIQSSISHQHIFFMGIRRLLMNMESEQGALDKWKSLEIAFPPKRWFSTRLEHASVLTTTSPVGEVICLSSRPMMGLMVLGWDLDEHRWHLANHPSPASD